MKPLILKVLSKCYRIAKFCLFWTANNLLYDNKQGHLVDVIAKRNLLDDKIRIVDIGARGGIQPKWRHASEFIEWAGFEPDAEECRSLNESNLLRNSSFSLYPYAVSNSAGKKPFFVTKFPDSSGFIPGNKEFLNRLYAVVPENLQIVKEIELETITLDTFVDQENFEADFIKIDVEGYEYHILEGAEKVLSQNSFLGVEVELWFGPIKQPDNFSKIDILLRQHGLHLFDIAVRKYPRKTFPRGFMQYSAMNTFKMFDSECFGQVLTGDAVYLRDPVWDLENERGGFNWNDKTVLKMALIYETYHLYDCAVELLKVYSENYSAGLPFQDLYDALTPAVNCYKRLKYADYIQQSESLPWHEMDDFKHYWKT